jgi:thiol reductant ABC exporter CydC subunit
LIVVHGLPTFRRLLALIGPFRGWILLGVLLSAATIGASVGLMAMSAYLISKAALVTAVADVALIVTAVRFFAIARATLRYAERYITHKATFRILTSLRVWCFRAVEPLAPARLQAYRGGDLLTRLVADIETLEGFYLRVVIPPLAALLVSALAGAILARFDPWLAVALLTYLLLAGAGLPLVVRHAGRRAAAEAIHLRAELTAALVDEVQGLADLVSFGQEAAQQAKVSALGQRLDAAQQRVATMRGLGNAGLVMLTGMAGLTLLVLAIPLVTSGRIEGVYLALLPLTALVSFEAVQPLAQALQTLESSQAAAGRVFELIDSPPEVGDPPAPLPPPPSGAAPDLEVASLSFRYHPNEPPVLDDVSFHIPPGGRLAIVGPSGAGKSTLVNLMTRFWDYHDGSIRLAGHDLHGYRADDVRALMAVVPQHTHLFHATLRDNLYVAAPEATDDELILACQKAQLHDFIQTLPEGYDTLIGENGVLLSGGERQRLAIARALLVNAPLLILDEPTAHLDSLTEAKVWQALDAHMAGRTTLLITHGRAGLAWVDEVLRLEHGRVVHEGSQRGLFTTEDTEGTEASSTTRRP